MKWESGWNQTLMMSAPSALKINEAALLSSRASATALEHASTSSFGTLGRTLSKLQANLSAGEGWVGQKKCTWS